MPYKRKPDKKKYQKTYHKGWYAKNFKTVRRQHSERKKEIIRWFKEYKATLCCSRCPENHPAAIEFHHSNPEFKDDAVSLLVSKGYGKDRILQEIGKCEVVCSNCHKKIHWNN